MISLIICSRSQLLPSGLITNIEKTIGAVYETIVIDNSDSRYSIFEAYNIGVSKSKYPYLCFMHDDITYLTPNWGKKVIDHFKNKQTGAIGIAGSPFAPFMPGSWWGSGLINQNIVPAGQPHDKPVLIQSPLTTTSKNQVILLDGVWICIRKKLFETIAFDERTYSGYHIYDLDISMQVHTAGYKLYSVFDILINHESNGILNSGWFNNAFLYHKKWKNKLPAACIKLNYNKQCELEYNTLAELIVVMIRNKIAKRDVYKMALTQITAYSQGFFYYKLPIIFFNNLARYLQSILPGKAIAK